MLYAAMLMMTSQILKSAGLTKTKISRTRMKEQDFENETLFFLPINCYFMTKNSFVAEVTFKNFEYIG